MIKFFIWVTLAAAAVQPVWAQQQLARQVEELVNEPGVARAHWGVAVVGMDGTPIYSLNEGQFFQPASTAKLFTTTAAVHLLGKEQRFTTRIEGPPGPKGDATLHGDLV